MTAAAADLVSFVPRLTLEWLRDRPEQLSQEIEGTLAFVDISGFTAMSEQLSSRGKAGAEEVTDIMNATFAALLNVAYANGGGLLKFGGDALLLFYDGDEHAARAARATFGMRRTLRGIGRPRTSAGTVTLRMHAGLHSGTFNFFLVGDSHRELLVTGPAATRTVEMEAASEAGDILLSPETAAGLDDAVLGEEKGPGRLLQGEPQTVAAVVPLPPVEAIPLDVAVPAPLRAQLLEVGPFEGEHRNAAVAFVRFAGMDDIVGSEGAEAAADALEALVRAVQGAAEEHGVTFLESDVDRDGGRIVLVAGAPQTFGDDEERMLRALRAALDSGLPLPAHVGVSRGRVFTGQVGASFRRTYTLLGDTAALAARLMTRAGEDEIWVSADAYARGGGRFAATELEPFAVKGKSEPVRAVVLGEIVDQGAAPVGEPTDETALPFVDRERERAVLSAAVAPVQMGFGTLVELIGEPGIGKSRLAKELQAHCAEMRKLSTRCDQYEATTPYHPFRPLLRSLLDVELNGGREHNRAVLAGRLTEIDEELEPWAPLLSAPLDVEVESTAEVDDLDPAFWRARLHGVLGKLLGALLDSPTLLLFEDVHWMDDASADLLRYLGTQLPTRPWLACTTRRGTDGGFAAANGTPPLPALSLHLEPIPEDDAKALVRAASKERALSDEELAALMERGAGNPLFLQELAAADDVEQVEDMPDTVEALVAARIDRLAPGDRALLRWASVLGVSFSGSLIAAVLEGDETVAAASEAWSRLGEFVEMDPDVPGAFRFRHALIRDAAYEGLSYKRRRDLHGRVAEVLEQREAEAELLSLHYLYAERWQEAWTWSVDAGRRAWEKHANVEAGQFYERALEVAARAGVAPREVARVWEALGDARIRAGVFESAGDAFRAARAALPGTPVEQARLLQKEALVPVRLAQYPEALKALERALAAVEGVDEDGAGAQRARILCWFGTVYQRQRHFDDALEWSRRAMAEAEAAGALDALAHAYRVLDVSYLALDRADEAVYSPRAIEILEQLGELEPLAWTINTRGARAFLEGRWNDALEHVERARELFERIGDLAWAAIGDSNLGGILSDQGRIDEAEARLRAALDVQTAAGNALDIAQTTSNLGRVAARAARFDEAAALFDRARELLTELEDEVELLTAESRALESLVLQGDDSAAAVADGLLSRATTTPDASMQLAMLRRLHGWALIQAGDLAAARDALDECLRILKGGGANPGFESTHFEVMSALDAYVCLLELTGEPFDEFMEERDQLAQHLGVVKLHRPPLPQR